MYYVFYEPQGHNFKGRPWKKELEVIRNKASISLLIIELDIYFSQLSG